MKSSKFGLRRMSECIVHSAISCSVFKLNYAKTQYANADMLHEQHGDGGELIRTIPHGSYHWKHPLVKFYLNFRTFCEGTLLFIQCMINYKDSVVGNELSVKNTWSLAHSFQEARIGKTYRIVWDEDGDM